MKLWTPHNYQMTAIDHILSKGDNEGGSILFLDPGLGKTSITLSCIKTLKYCGISKGALVVAPLRVAYKTWPEEIEGWSNFNNLSFCILHGPGKTALWTEPKDVYLINPEGLKWLHDELLDGLKKGHKQPFNTLWVDESTKFKNPQSGRFEFLSNMTPLFVRRNIMTGTPSSKSLLDLWSQVNLVDDGKALGSNYYNYRRKYFTKKDDDSFNYYLKGPKAVSKIRDAIKPLTLNMSAEKYLDMPDLLVNNIRIDMPTKALKTYARMENELFITLDDMEATADTAAQKFMKCHQIANGKVYEDIPEDLSDEEVRLFKKTRKVLPVHTSKIEALKDLVDELNGKPLLVAYHYVHDMEAIRSEFGNVPFIGSGVSVGDSSQLVEQWNKGNIPLLLGHPMSMGHGLNMQKGGNDICWFSLTPSLENYLQMNARIYRQGVSGSVRIHRLACSNTVDELMLKRLDSRDKEQKSFRQSLSEYREEHL